MSPTSFQKEKRLLISSSGASIADFNNLALSVWRAAEDWNAMPKSSRVI